MASITISNIDPDVEGRLRVQAAQQSHSMEAEARRILHKALETGVRPSKERNLYERIRARFEPLGGVDLDLPPRERAREPPRFD